jgi:hypothetical protein
LGETLVGPSGSLRNFQFTRTLNAGDSVYFGVGPNGNYNNDSTGFNVVITDIPEPGTVAMVVAGLALTLVARRRRA